MKLNLLNEDNKPLRNRVEVFAVKDEKVYGGIYDDGSFGVFGGGIDGESLEDAASREFEEESGHKIDNIKRLDVEPVIAKWDEDNPKSEKQKERMKKYSGTKTWYYYGQLNDSGNKDKADGDDGKSGLRDIGLKDIDFAISKLDIDGIEDKGLINQYKARKKALELLKDVVNE